jgi:hypothetical protein
MSLLFRKASSIIRKVHGVAEGQTGALASGSVLMLKNDRAVLGHVGQTGAFLIRGTVVTALNRDHAGDAMGQNQPFRPGVAHFKTAGDDYLVLLSEGPQETVSKSELKDIADLADSTDDFAETMLNLASRRTEKDVSCVIIDIERTDDPAVAPTAAPTEGDPGEPAAGAAAGAGEAAENNTEASAEPKADEEPLGDVEGHIKRYELFLGIPAEQVERMIAQLSELPVEQGHVLYEEGAPMTQLYLVTQGRVELKRRGGRPRDVGPGTFLCETALLQGMVQIESATAQTSAKVLSLSQMALAQLTVTDPQFGVRLYHNLARLMALRLFEKG